MMVPEGPESCNLDDLQVDAHSRPEGRAETPATPRSLPDLLGMPVSEPMMALRADSDDGNNHDGVSITAGNQKVIADDPPATADEPPAERAETAGPQPSLSGLLVGRRSAMFRLTTPGCCRPPTLFGSSPMRDLSAW